MDLITYALLKKQGGSSGDINEIKNRLNLLEQEIDEKVAVLDAGLTPVASKKGEVIVNEVTDEVWDRLNNNNADVYAAVDGVVIRATYAVNQDNEVEISEGSRVICTISEDDGEYSIDWNEYYNDADISLTAVGVIGEALWVRGTGSNAIKTVGASAAVGDYSVAEGYNTTAVGRTAHAEGQATWASGAFSHAEGGGTVASGDYSHAEGIRSTASATSSHAEGYESTASKDYAHAEGYMTVASEYNAHAEGHHTTSAGFASHAEGQFSTASGETSHAEGNRGVATGFAAHAEGSNTSAPGSASHAEGTKTIANASNMHAGGSYNIAASIVTSWVKNTSYSVGDIISFNDCTYKCITANSDSSWNESKWEIIHQSNGDTAFVVGNGVDANNRSNAMKVDWNGNQYLMGDVYVGCDSNSANGMKVATVNEVNALEDRIDAIEEAEGLHRYGVSGIGQQTDTLTRIWDSVGMTAQVGTDGDNSNVINNFDDVTPFNRRKCVGKWHLEDGRAQFVVHAYYGDENYTEDGSMGDYVAVECPRAYYYLNGGTLGVSAHHYQGWKPFDIFCHNHNIDETFEYAYLPAYQLGVKDGHAVSLPGLDNSQGNYKTLFDTVRTYDGDGVENLAILEPAAVEFYEWALQTVEFAKQVPTSVMKGCTSLRSDDTDSCVFTDTTHILTNNYYTGRVVGESICIYGGNAGHTNVNYQATHKILSIIRCDETGNPDSSGEYQLIEVEDYGKNYFTYDTTGATSYWLAGRPWRTGSCNSVSTPSGSPVSNTSGYYPMKYRWRENTHGNQYHTCTDLFNKRIDDGDDVYHLEWYYLPKPQDYIPSTSSKPDSADLDTDAFIKVGETPASKYVNYYIVKRQYTEEYPEIWFPDYASGGSATTYYGTYASLVSYSVVRAVRFGCAWCSGSCIFYANSSPSTGLASYGCDLYFPQ